MIQVSFHGAQWSVKVNRRVVKVFDTEEEAHDYAQRLAEQSAWNAANRD